MIINQIYSVVRVTGGLPAKRLVAGTPLLLCCSQHLLFNGVNAANKCCGEVQLWVTNNWQAICQLTNLTLNLLIFNSCGFVKRGRTTAIISETSERNKQVVADDNSESIHNIFLSLEIWFKCLQESGFC